MPDAGETVGGPNPACYWQEVLDAIEVLDADRFIPFKAHIKLIDGRPGRDEGSYDQEANPVYR
ncbi:MAG: hypothetical protein AB7I59_29920 [Geminicoccaceae bacterium]|uniref:hypothetical protein n=1 Tax=Reyranella sp. TaxID=1929291 RepID=UPI003D0A7CDB